MDLGPDLARFVRTVLPSHCEWTLVPLVDSHNLVIRAVGPAESIVVRLQPVERMSDATARVLREYLGVLSDDPALRVPRPVRLADGSWTADVEWAGRPLRCSLLSWVPGERVADARSFVEPGRLRAIGVTVAQMHEHAVARFADRAGEVPRLDADALFGAQSWLGHPALGEDVGLPTVAKLERAAAEMTQLLASCEPSMCALIHADLEPQNWIFHEGQPGVIDFDEVRHGPLAVDLNSVLWTHALWDEWPALRSSLIEGYESVRGAAVDRVASDAWMAVSFSMWLQFIYTELSASERARHQQYVEPMVARVLQWCGVDYHQAAGGQTDTWRK